MTVHVLLAPAWVAVTVHVRVDPVLFDAVSVVPLRLNPVPEIDKVGLPVSVPVFVPFVKISRMAVVVIEDVPPAAVIVVGLALTLTVQLP